MFICGDDPKKQPVKPLPLKSNISRLSELQLKYSLPAEWSAGVWDAKRNTPVGVLKLPTYSHQYACRVSRAAWGRGLGAGEAAITAKRPRPSTTPGAGDLTKNTGGEPGGPSGEQGNRKQKPRPRAGSFNERADGASRPERRRRPTWPRRRRPDRRPCPRAARRAGSGWWLWCDP